MNVSVIIPVYNAERFLEKAIRSALEQPETKEVIVADDCSTDSSKEIASRLAAEDSRIKMIMHPDGGNHGTPATRNLGIKNATTEYIALLDNDDFFLPDRFSKAKEILEKEKDIDGVYEAIGTYAYDDTGLKAHIDRMKEANVKDPQAMLTTMEEVIAPEALFEELLFEKKGWFHLNGLTLRRSVFDKVGYLDEELIWEEDREFFFRLTAKARLATGRIDEPVAMRGVYKGNRTLTPELNVKALKYTALAWKKMFIYMLKDKFSKEANRYLLKMYLNCYSESFLKMPAGVNRKLMKGINLLKIVIQHPSLILKIF